MRLKCTIATLVGFFLIIFGFVGGAQALVVNPTGDAETLASNLIGAGITLVPGSATYTGAANASGLFSGGAASGLDFDKGILLTSGDAVGAVGPNNTSGYTGDNGLPGYPPLSALSGHTTYDATILSFKFETVSGDLYFRYVFASEEYNEYVGSQFNDVFAFFVDGVNVALVPGTNDPVTINTINNGANSAYYVDNITSVIYDIQYDGFTTNLVAKALGLGTGQHEIVLAIADASDYILDSGVFIQGSGFSPEPPQPIPAPATLLLLGTGLCLMGLRRRLH